MVTLTKNEEWALLSTWRLDGDAYIVTIRNHIESLTGKSINYGSLCNTLCALVRKGLIESRESAPKAQQGGRRKVLYFLTMEGKRALKHAYQIQQVAWDGIGSLLIDLD